MYARMTLLISSKQKLSSGKKRQIKGKDRKGIDGLKTPLASELNFKKPSYVSKNQLE